MYYRIGVNLVLFNVYKNKKKESFDKIVNRKCM